MKKTKGELDGIKAKEFFDNAVRNEIIKNKTKQMINREFNRMANSAQWEFLGIEEVGI